MPGPGESARLVFEDLETESNGVSLSASPDADGRVSYVVRDDLAPLSAGSGCSGGGDAGSEAVCSLPRSRGPSNCFGTTNIICLDPALYVGVAMRLGQGDDLLDTTGFAGDGGAPLYFDFEVEGGPGDDMINTGGTNDEVDPGPGADRVLTAAGFDEVIASEASADGADTLDLGPGPAVDHVSYERSIGSVSISANGAADDGAPGEGDNVIAAEWLTGGAGDDMLVGAENPEAVFGDVATETLDGGAGDDVLLGNGGPDKLDGDGAGLSGGDDVLHGGAGADEIAGWDGADIAFGGGGDDSIYLGRGDDRGSGAGGSDYLVADQGDDRLRGGSGRDRLTAAENSGAGLPDHPQGRDRVDCGPARDRATIDAQDGARRCERVKPID